MDAKVRRAECAQAAQAARDHVGTAGTAGAGHCSSLSSERAPEDAVQPRQARFAGFICLFIFTSALFKTKR